MLEARYRSVVSWIEQMHRDQFLPIQRPSKECTYRLHRASWNKNRYKSVQMQTIFSGWIGEASRTASYHILVDYYQPGPIDQFAFWFVQTVQNNNGWFRLWSFRTWQHLKASFRFLKFLWMVMQRKKQGSWFLSISVKYLRTTYRHSKCKSNKSCPLYMDPTSPTGTL